jgi:ABC-2 type transport system permease protein
VRDTLHLYGSYLAASLRSQLQYRASFLMMTAAVGATSFLEFATVWALFERFGRLADWSLPEAAVLYGLVNVAFALSEALARGFDDFPSMVRSGSFDRVLLRPRSTALQVAGSRIQLMRIGRLLQALLVLAWGAHALQIRWTLEQVGIACLAIGGGVALFSGLLVLQATFSFWSTESLEVFNIATYGGVETTQYPLSVYRRELRTFFTWFVPLATVTYFPTLAILNRSDPLGSTRAFQTWCPLLGWLFLAICLQIWEIGVRHYRSTGS